MDIPVSRMNLRVKVNRRWIGKVEKVDNVEIGCDCSRLLREVDLEWFCDLKMFWVMW